MTENDQNEIKTSQANLEKLQKKLNDLKLSRKRSKKYRLDCKRKLDALGYLLKRGTTWNTLKRSETIWSDLKRPTTTQKRLETAYNEQETIWDDLQQARNDLKRPATSKML